MSKFDLIFENTIRSLREQHYVNSTFVDNIRLLVKMLQESDYLPDDKSLDVTIDELMRQTDNVKEIVLDTKEKSLPPIKLQIKQDFSDSENFSVKVINLEKPAEQKEFANSMLETIFNDVIDYIKTISLEKLQPEAAVDTLPSAEGANAQPGGGESALPNI